MNQDWRHLSPLCAIRRITEVQLDYKIKAPTVLTYDPFTHHVWLVIGNSPSTTFVVKKEAYVLIKEWVGVLYRVRAPSLKVRFKCIRNGHKSDILMRRHLQYQQLEEAS